MARISFENVTSKYPNGKGTSSSNNNSFDILNFISIIIGIGGLVSSFFIPVIYSILICIVGIVVGVLSTNKRVSGIVVSIFSLIIILVMIISIACFKGIRSFINNIKKEESITYNIRI